MSDIWGENKLLDYLGRGEGESNATKTKTKFSTRPARAHKILLLDYMGSGESGRKQGKGSKDKVNNSACTHTNSRHLAVQRIFFLPHRSSITQGVGGYMV